MIHHILLTLGAILIISCGSIHVLLTKSIINGFNNIKEENKKILFLEWVIEGLMLYFISILVLVITISGLSEDIVSKIFFGASFVILLVMTILSLLTVVNLMTGDLNLKPKIKIILSIHFKSCPIIKISAGILFLLAIFL